MALRWLVIKAISDFLIYIELDVVSRYRCLWDDVLGMKFKLKKKEKRKRGFHLSQSHGYDKHLLRVLFLHWNNVAVCTSYLVVYAIVCVALHIHCPIWFYLLLSCLILHAKRDKCAF